jgi:transposase
MTLNDEERAKLAELTRRSKTSQAMALRCRVILECAKGLTNSQVAQRLGASLPTVGKWRARFAKNRLAGLSDAPRPGQPRKITDEQVERVVTETLESTPRNATHWSTRSMAKQSGLTQNAIHRIWRAFGLKPHLQETFKLSTDPFFVEKVRDVVGLYLNPPEQTRAVV